MEKLENVQKNIGKSTRITNPAKSHAIFCKIQNSRQKMFPEKSGKKNLFQNLRVENIIPHFF